MGLFSKKICAVCGGKAGAIINYKLADDGVMCADCREKCTPGINSKDMKMMTVGDIDANMAVASANRAKYENEFQTTRSFCTGSRRDKPVIDVDENHGWWVNTAKNEGWVFDLDNITGSFLRLSTSRLSDEERKKKGFWDFLFEPNFYSQYPELPQCPYGEKITGMYFHINMVPSELGLSEMEIDVFPGFFTDQNDIAGAYACSHELYEFFNDWHNRRITGANNANASASEDVTETIVKLHSLMEQGILTQEEFDMKKKQLLGL